MTIDALGCQKDIVKEIISKEADYVLSFKENHPLLHQEIEQFFMDCGKDSFKEVVYDYYEEYSKGGMDELKSVNTGLLKKLNG